MAMRQWVVLALQLLNGLGSTKLIGEECVIQLTFTKGALFETEYVSSSEIVLSCRFEDLVQTICFLLSTFKYSFLVCRLIH